MVFVGLSHRGSRSDKTMLRLPWYDSPTILGLRVGDFLFHGFRIFFVQIYD